MVENSRKQRVIESVLKLAIGLVVLVLLNVVVSRYYFRWDLTEENRYSIGEPSKKLLNNLDDVVYIEVYLTGDLNAEFKRFRTAIRETLDEFRMHAGVNIQYAFVDPMEAEGAAAKKEFEKHLADKGIVPTDLFDTEKGKKISKRLYPGALLSYGGKELGVMLLKGNKGASASEQLNQSIEGVEYELASGIRKLIQSDRKRLAIIQGHNELDSMQMADLTNSLLQSYDVYKVNLPQKESLEGYDAAILAQPKMPIRELDKYKIDQFVMRGGALVALIDQVQVNMDSVGGSGTLGFPLDLNLGDLFYKYGLRINANLVQDLNSGVYPVVVGNVGNQPQIKSLPWPYFVVANSYGKHPITRNLDASYLRFVSTIDTVLAQGIQKTPILYSSVYSRALQAPLLVSLNSLREITEDKFMNQHELPVGYLLEGRFSSLFKNKFLPAGAKKSSFREDGVEAKILLIADGDLARNDINYRKLEPFPLGFDAVSGTTFANSDLLLNALEYLLDENGIINARNKEIKIRPLDKIKVADERSMWQLINLVLPIVFLILAGVLGSWLRKRKYSRF